MKAAILRLYRIQSMTIKTTLLFLINRLGSLLTTSVKKDLDHYEALSKAYQAARPSIPVGMDQVSIPSSRDENGQKPSPRSDSEQVEEVLGVPF